MKGDPLMKIVRGTLYGPDCEPGASCVMRESDLNCSIEQVAADLPLPGAYTAAEVFTMDGQPTIEQATAAAVRRIDTARERNEAILYYWTIAALHQVNAGGVLVSPKPAPLSAERVRAVLAQVVTHGSYRQQRFVIHASDEVVLWPQPAGVKGVVN